MTVYETENNDVCSLVLIFQSPIEINTKFSTVNLLKNLRYMYEEIESNDIGLKVNKEAIRNYR